MPAPADTALPLEGLFLHLVRAGLPLSPRDYVDALRALRLGHGIGGRGALQSLVTALWARSDEERRLVDAAFGRLRRPDAAEVHRLTGEAARQRMREEDDGARVLGDDRADHADHADHADPADEPGLEQPELEPDGERAGLRVTPPAFAFDAAGAGDGGGWALPGAVSHRARLRGSRTHVHEPRPALAVRSLVVAWRRYRRLQRSGPPVEIDMAATVERLGRTGYLLEPVRVPARRNRAALLVLLDSSPSMRPWWSLHGVLAASLAQSRLERTALYTFDNDPRMGLATAAGAPATIEWSEALQHHAGTPLIVIGDAGAVRGRHDRERRAGTRLFLREAARALGPIAWLNPMPRARWGAGLQPLSGMAPMFELDDDGLTQAVDTLRGLRAG